MNKKHVYIIVVLLIVAILAAFSRIAGNEFINFDDNQYITENRNIQSGFNSQTLKWAFTAVVVSNWHPLTLLSHMLDWSLFGANAAGHHLVSLLLHIGTVIFLFLFLYKTTHNLWPSAFAAAFFAIHPLRVESVAWASERKDVLSMFLGMACIYAYAFYAENKKPHKYLLCLILFVLALMAKPMLVTLPCVLLLVDYWPLKQWTGSDSIGDILKKTGRLVREKVPFFVLTIVFTTVTFWTHHKGGSVSSADAISFLNRLSNAAVSYVAYLVKTFQPFKLAIYYPYDFPLPLWQVMISVMILVLISAVVIYYIGKLPFLFVGWFWYLGTLVPVIGLVQVGSQAMADRYTYLPSIGLALILAWGTPLLFQKDALRRNVMFPAGVAILVILSVLTWRQSGYWKDSITLFSRALQVTEKNYIAHNHLASAQLKKRKFEQSIQHYNEAIRIQPVYYHAYYNRGIAFYAMGKKLSALNDFKKTVSLMPDNSKYATAYFNLAAVYHDLGLYESALKNYSKAILLKPDYAEAYRNRALVHFNRGNSSGGCTDAHKACELGTCTSQQAAETQALCR